MMSTLSGDKFAQFEESQNFFDQTPKAYSPVDNVTIDGQIFFENLKGTYRHMVSWNSQLKGTHHLLQIQMKKTYSDPKKDRWS